MGTREKGFEMHIPKQDNQPKEIPLQLALKRVKWRRALHLIEERGIASPMVRGRS